MNPLKNFKVWFVSVPNLIQIYESQNRLAAEAAAETARNRTSVNLKSMEISAEERAQQRRQAQEQKLAEFAAAMDNLRQMRDIGSREKQALVAEEGANMRAQLGKETTAVENEKQRAFEMSLNQFKEQKAGERQALELPLRQAQEENLRAEAERTRALIPSQAARSEAEAKLATTQADILARPDIDTMVQSVSKLTSDKETKKALIKSLGQKGYDQMLTNLTNQLKSSGVDPNSVPGVAEQSVAGAKKKYEALASEVSTFVDQQIAQGAEQKFNERLSMLQDRIASGRYTSEDIKKMRTLLLDWGKKSGVRKDLLSQI